MTRKTQRRLAAIVSADVVGYSSLVEVDEVGTIAALRNHRTELIDVEVDKHGGRIVKTMGDGFLIEFPSVVDAVNNAIAIQEGMSVRNLSMLENKRIVFRFGVNLGDVVVEGDDIFGEGVNIASRLEQICDPGAVFLSRSAFDQVKGKINFQFKNLGLHRLKNINSQVRVFCWHPAKLSMHLEPSQVQSLSSTPDERGGTPSIAVLSFDNLSNDSEQEYFAEGIAEDITTGLCRMSDLVVAARSSSFRYRGQSVDIRQVGKELGVQYVLEGSVRRFGEQLRITAQLIDAETGNHIWAEKFDCATQEMLLVQDDITTNVVGTIGSEIRSAEIGRARKLSPRELGSWERLMKAYWHFHKEKPADNAIAQKLLVEEIEINGGNSTCHALLGFSYCFDSFFWGSEDYLVGLEKAEHEGQRALELDQRNELAHSLLSMTYRLKGDKKESLRAAERAIAINPNDTSGHSALGYALTSRGSQNYERAKTHLKFGLQLGSGDIWACWSHAELAVIALLENDFEQALEYSHLALDHHPSHGMSLRVMASALALYGRIDEAREVWARALEANPMEIEGYYERLRKQFEDPGEVEPFIRGMKIASRALQTRSLDTNSGLKGVERRTGGPQSPRRRN